MPPLPLKQIGLFALRFVLIYGLLVAAWPILGSGYRALFCGLGNVLFEGGEASVHFQPMDTPGAFDTQLMMRKRSTGVRGHMKVDSRLVGYLPTVSLIAFVLATPISWKRRRRALLAGLALVTVFVALRMGIPLWRDFSNPNALQVYHPSAFSRRVLGVAQRALLEAPASWFVIPIFIWVGVAFRRADWQLLDEGAQGGAEKA